MTDLVEQVLAGPRGRRALAHLVGGPHEPPHRPALWHAEHLLSEVIAGRIAVDAVAAHLAERVAASDLPALAATADPAQLLPALLVAVDSARSWQEPDAEDQLLALPGVTQQLRPVAEAVIASPAARWWTDPVALPDGSSGLHGCQHHVQHLDEDPDLPGAPAPRVVTPEQADDALARWRRGAVEEEEQAARERPVRADASWSGSWWSTPALAGLLATTPDLPALATTPPERTPPAGVVLVEDSMGWPVSAARRMRPREGLRVYEVDGPAAWTALVSAHPLRVTRSRRHDWYRATGWQGSWAVPDWHAVAQEWDGVHVSVLGYLSTAGRALETAVDGERGEAAEGLAPGRARTVLAGWDPATTWWLSDAAMGFEEPVRWRPGAGDQALRWEAEPA